jgi:sugar transferase EpsL
VRQALKRTLDILVAIFGIIVLAPVLVLITAAVRLSLGSPVLFRQTRAGLHGKPFEIVKFRTLTDARGVDGQLLPHRQRTTPLGNWLRATSLDELPQLWNVVQGEMSLVGPRPLLVDYLPMYSDSEAQRHEMKPGITGWAQIHPQDNMSWVDVFELDVWYVRNHTFALDLRILWRTIPAVIQRRRVIRSRGVFRDRFARSPVEETPSTPPPFEPSRSTARAEVGGVTHPTVS